MSIQESKQKLPFHLHKFHYDGRFRLAGVLRACIFKEKKISQGLKLVFA